MDIYLFDVVFKMEYIISLIQQLLLNTTEMSVIVFISTTIMVSEIWFNNQQLKVF